MEKKKYDHRKIEQKWQRIWEEKKIFHTEVDPSKPKYYVLDMFPYPSGAGLHVGHVTGYTATDIIARYKRQQGFNVLHPMGWDSFGLPAEQYAIRTGTHPAITTEKNIRTYRRQLKSLGFSYDWDREITTSSSDYYKWTQWIFTKLYEKGLAYEAEAYVNYCPELGTVLANEEVEEGKSKEGGFPVVRKPLRQWILKITAYADRLIEDLALIDWPESLKKLQINWIGRSEGAKIHFKETKTGKDIVVFSTRHDTLFGATFLVLAPEHPLIEEIVAPEMRAEVTCYQEEALSKSDRDRTDLNKTKTGVFTGAYAKNPVDDSEIPIWIADYVLMGYGTGAIMAVPSSDERDFEFAIQRNLAIQPVIEPDEDLPEELKIEVIEGRRPWVKSGKLINSGFLNGLTIEEAKEKMIQFLEQRKWGERCVNYKLRDWLFSRQRYWGEPFPILHFEDGSKRVLDLDELPLCPPHIEDFKPSGSGDSPLAKVKEWIEIVDTKTGKKARRETNTMPQWAGSCWYYLRFCDPHNETYAWDPEVEKYWMPVDLYVGGVEHAVLHLLYARFWHKVLYDSKLVSTLEPFQALRNQGLVVAKAFQKKGGGFVYPEEVKEEGGRYYHIETGEELSCQMEKMSKSKLNGISPDEIIEEFGADTLRLYEMFMGPFDREKVWSTEAMTGCFRFLNRFFDLIHSEKVVDSEEKEGMRLAHRLAHACEKDLSSLQFNTAIAKMMEFLNDFTPLEKYPKKALKMLTQLVYPFAPHIAEEAWEHLGESESLTYVPYPEVDPSFLVDSTATYVVQINGKTRGSFTLPKDQSQEELLSFVKRRPDLQKYLEGTIAKVVYVPNRLMSLVVE